MTRRRRPINNEGGASLILVLVLVTVVSVLVAAMLSSADTGMRTTVALREESTRTYAADGATQAAVNTIRNSTFKGVTGESCFTGGNTLALPTITDTHSAAVECSAAPAQIPCALPGGCNRPVTAATLQDCGPTTRTMNTLWLMTAADKVYELTAAGTPTGRSIPVPTDFDFDVAISPDGKTMYVLSADGRIATITVATGAVVRTIDANGPGIPNYAYNNRRATSLSMAPNGKLYLSNSSPDNDGSLYGPAQPIVLVDPTLTSNNARVIGTLPMDAAGDFVTLPDKTLLGVGGDGSLFAYTVNPDGTLSTAHDVGTVPKLSVGGLWGPYGMSYVNGSVYLAYELGVTRISPTPSVTNPASTNYTTVPYLITAGALTGGPIFRGLTSAQESDGCSVPTSITKTPGSVTGPNASGVYTATDTVTVTNTSGLPGAYGGLTYSAQVDPNYLVLTGANWTLPGGSTGSGSPPGPWPLFTGIRNLAAGASDTFQVTTTFTKTINASTPSNAGGMLVTLSTYVCRLPSPCAPSGTPARRARIVVVDSNPSTPVSGQRQIKIMGWSNRP